MLAVGSACESPFSVLDEPDIFMDHANRDSALLTIYDFAMAKRRQVIVITPQNLTYAALVAGVGAWLANARAHSPPPRAVSSARTRTSTLARFTSTSYDRQSGASTRSRRCRRSAAAGAAVRAQVQERARVQQSRRACGAMGMVAGLCTRFARTLSTTTTTTPDHPSCAQCPRATTSAHRPHTRT